MNIHPHKHKIISLPLRLINTSTMIIISAFVIWLVACIGYAETSQPRSPYKIVLEKLPSQIAGGYGYKLQYTVLVPIKAFWQFKTDFTGELLLTSDELVGHRLVKTVGNSVVTENRYASSPELEFLWQTTFYPEQYRLEFKLLNAAECRHDFHYGTIQLISAGENTKVIQVAYFDFTGASIWVNYPWYGGMKSTLTRVAKWEQKTALRYASSYLVAQTFKPY